ncbi:glycosyltransferase [Alkalilimnicola sp. S0819]|uniref:glycosyltransferase n=1 Tax=Alkalilimnicola sp. S0819 TaxID=2613922 RepID=UPI0012617970|nr:glycosyltransferase [Alkalilimnicola sp. S0819]KAB7622856.1 glycosyltransferase [Alkalilimnicola sp. S0819]MPQ17178.1 glycosyltransferase [Alkalilimnicola sp. S0819]
MPAKRVLFLLDCLYQGAGGGSERQFLKLYRHAAEIGIDPYVAFLRTEAVHRQLDWARPPLQLQLKSLRSPALPLVLWRLKRLVSRERIEVLHTLFDDATLCGGLLKALCPGLRLICSQRNLGHAHSGLRKRLLGAVFRRGEQVVVNARVIAHMLEAEYGVAPQRTRVIPNMYEAAPAARPGGADLHALRRRHGMLAVVVANLRPVKGIDDLLAAARQTADLDLGYVLIGDGGGLASYRREVAAAGLQARVHLLGARDDVPAWLAMADLAILPSRSEGMSNALVEYMFAGLPIVATRVGGNVEALDGGRCGVLVAPRSPAGLAAGIRALVDDPPRRARLGRCAHRYAEGRYTVSRVSAAYRRLYRCGPAGSPR